MVNINDNGSEWVKETDGLSQDRIWSLSEKFLFRTAFIFFILFSIPLSGRWYADLFSINWLRLHYRDIYDIARFSPVFLGRNSSFFLLGYGDWLLLLLVALVGALVWSLIDRKTQSYERLYYWLRVIVRFRAGIGIIGFGFTKLLPVQMPYPSLGLLNTNFGDFTAQKIYWLSIGIVPWYQVFAGVVECVAGAFLFFRKTIFLGALLLSSALGDITYVNFAYDGGVHVYASYFVVFSAFLLLYYVKDIYIVLIRQEVVVPHWYVPVFAKRLRWTRFGLKTVTITVFLVLLFYVQLINFWYDPYKQPAVAGEQALRGNYRVEEFTINGKALPYSPLDTALWQNVTFENWSSLSFTTNKPHVIDLSNGGGSPMRDIDRTFEVTGAAGGKNVYHYEADTVNHILYLEDKNIAGVVGKIKRGGETNKASLNNLNYGENREARHTEKKKENWIPDSSLKYIKDERLSIQKIAYSARRDNEFAEKQRKVKRGRMVLHYQTIDGSEILLSGIDSHNDSIVVKLVRCKNR
ncbi:hypothetical protein [Rhizosphaericola mali]|uniref:DoxX family protein n=1 Tax=Rhizosphaericola mali TaxID=2545455 RepID=A0A5P2G4R9_9BACT|nr:hypothetical protein [Rhizosphaericola mali]QES89688.1 hypothetical protein E0W69_013795 [Rhizosphaericola mali]